MLKSQPYNNKEEAMAVIARYSRIIDFDVSVLLISESSRQHISIKGLPLFSLAIK